jgi:hypothetical protein
LRASEISGIAGTGLRDHIAGRDSVGDLVFVGPENPQTRLDDNVCIFLVVDQNASSGCKLIADRAEHVIRIHKVYRLGRIHKLVVEKAGPSGQRRKVDAADRSVNAVGQDQLLGRRIANRFSATGQQEHRH